MKNSDKNIDPTTVKKWLALIIAVLTAIAGAITENVTGFVGNII